MEKICIALALLGITAVCSYADNSTAKDAKAVVTTHNQLADLTTVETRQVKVTIGDRSVNAQASYSYEGKVLRRPAEITFRLSTTNPQRIWTEMDNFIYFKFGDKTAKGPVDLLIEGTFGADKSEIIETLTTKIPTGFFETIFSSKEIVVAVRGDKTPPFYSDLRENFPFDEVALSPFKELIKSTSPKQ